MTESFLHCCLKSATSRSSGTIGLSPSAPPLAEDYSAATNHDHGLDAKPGWLATGADFKR
jgi:hypothetical protein